MKYVYWGGVNTGKSDIMLRCLVEEKSYIFLKVNYISKCIPKKINDNTIEKKVYHLWSPNGKYEETYYQTSQVNLSNLFVCTERNPQITIDQTQTEQEKQQTIRKKVFTEGENVYDNLPSVKEVIDTVDYIILGDSLAAYKNKFTKELFLYKNIKHIVPYRIVKDPISMISKINMYPDGDYFNLYKNNKSKAFEYLDHFTMVQRDIEKTLIQNNVDITYFDLDSYDYTLLDLNSYKNQNLSFPGYNMNNPKIKQRYDLAYSIAQEYLETRCLSDTRIRGAVIDGIEV